jgi:2-polyprenyl-6-methoxyphenol hydroxylase-like FAD-dependent oxidoreductase
LIVGAGIAGLALGRALLSRGFSVEVIERAAAWPVTGAGLYLPGNGVRAITALGLADALMARAVPMSHQRILDHRGRVLSEIDLRRVWGPVGPCVSIRRADLHRVLLDGAAGIPIRLSTTITSVTQTPGNVCVHFDDGRSRFYDAVIGADGVNSSIRRLVFGDIQPRDVGRISWRFIAPETHGVTAWTAMLGRGRTFLMIPVGSGGLYCYADRMANGTERRDRDRELESLRELFRDFGEPVPRVLAQLEDGDGVHVGPIEEVHLDRVVDRRVVLIGDAAHATSPSMAQGASMAIEDALILARALTSVPSPVEALAVFAARRRRRVEWVRRRTHRRDRIRRLPALLRNLSLRWMGAAIYEADYRPLFDEP